jgi:hypothetical protein
MSTSTGPGRGPRATRKAARSIFSRSRTSRTHTLRLVTGPMIEVTSASWKPSVPISSLRTWPVIATIGIESICESRMPVTRFVAPGENLDALSLPC